MGHHQQGAECDPLESQPLNIRAYAQLLACGCKLSKITTLACAVTMTTSDHKTREKLLPVCMCVCVCVCVCVCARACACACVCVLVQRNTHLTFSVPKLRDPARIATKDDCFDRSWPPGRSRTVAPR